MCSKIDGVVPTFSPSLFELFINFFMVGAQAFGGHAALAAQIQTEVVARQRWLSLEDFNLSVGLAMLLPGPMAVNVVSNVGFTLRGWAGSLVACLGILTPGFILVLGFAIFYNQLVNVELITIIIQGLLVGVSAVVAIAAYRLCQRLSNKTEYTILVLTALAFLFAPGAAKIFVILGAMACALLLSRILPPVATVSSSRNSVAVPRRVRWCIMLCCVGASLLLVLSTQLNTNVLLLDLAIGFTSHSLILFGGAFSFIPMIGNLVVDQGWLSAQAFADGVAIAQFTPGPVLISSAFIGYQIGGIGGAIVATIALFGPPAVLINLISGWIKAGNRQAAFKRLFFYVTGVITALIIVSCGQLFMLSIVGHSTNAVVMDIVVFMIAVMLLFFTKIAPIIVVSGCAISVLLFSFITF